MIELDNIETFIFFVILMLFLMLYVQTHDFRKTGNNILNIKDISVILIYSVLIGFRWTGNDLVLYADGIKQIFIHGLSAETEGTRELFYQAVIWCMMKIQCSISWYFFVIAFGHISLLLLLIRRYFRKEACYVIFFYFTSLQFVISLNGMRQMFAILFLLNIVCFIQQKRPFKYVIGVLVATCLHSSAVIFMPLYFVINRIFLKDNRYALLILYSLIFVSSNFIFKGIFSNLSNYVDYLSAFSDKASYLSGETSALFIDFDKSNSLGLSTIFNYLTTFYIVFYHEKFLNGKLINRVFFNLAYIGCCLTCISGNSIFLMRVTMYFSICIIFPLAVITMNLIRERKLVLPIFIGVFYFAWFFNCVYKETAGCSPYKMFFMF